MNDTTARNFTLDDAFTNIRQNKIFTHDIDP